MAPSLVTWPTRKAAMPRPLARSMSRAAHSRTWLTLPGADSSPGRKTVWIESTMGARGQLGALGARGEGPLLDQRDEAPRAGAVRAGAGLRRREATGLTPIDRSDLGHQGFGATTCSLARSPVLIVERMRARRRKLRCAPSRNETMLSYSVGSTTSFPRVPSPALSFSLTARRLARAARTSTPAWPMLSSFPP